MDAWRDVTRLGENETDPSVKEDLERTLIKVLNYDLAEGIIDNEWLARIYEFRSKEYVSPRYKHGLERFKEWRDKKG